MDVYTREQLERGEGLFVNGRTLIYRVGPDRYITCGRHEVPRDPNAVLAGGGQLYPGKGRQSLEWCG